MKGKSSVRHVAVRILGTTVALLTVLSFLGCVKDRYMEGYEKGHNDGLADGWREGYQKASQETFEVTEPEAYDRKLNDLLAEDRFVYHKGFLALSIVGGLLVGFCTQYALFLLLRRHLILNDIDQMILGKSIAADLHSRSPEEIFQSISDRLNETAGATPKRLSS